LKTIFYFTFYLKKSVSATFEQIAVSDLAEQMTLIDHKLFFALDSEYDMRISLLFDDYLSLSRELLLQGWMKPGRDDLAPNVALVSRRFNEVEKTIDAKNELYIN